jgi:chromosome segregation ATPase
MNNEILECQYCGRSKKGDDPLCGRCRDQGEVTELRREIVALTAKVKQLEEHQKKMSMMATPSDAMRDENRRLHKQITGLQIGRNSWKAKSEQLQKEMSDAEDEIRNSFNVNKPGEDLDGFPSRISFLIHEVWKRDPKIEKITKELKQLLKSISGE